MRAGLALLISLLVAMLAGCSTTTSLSPAQPGPLAEAREQDRYHVHIETHDGIRLKATVYQPAIEPGETAPLIIATHGYGGFRAPRPFSIYGKTMLTGQAAIEAWRQGYWVVFYDQRGFGGSQGKVNMMDLDKEVRDVSTVIDWSLAHLPAITEMPDGGPAIGMIGESYGGGAQLLASIQDERLRAIVPIAAWHNMADALAPNDHVRSNWGSILLILPAITSGFDTQGLSKPWRSMIGGSMNTEVREILEQRSPQRFCEQGQHPQADALLVQGFRDTMMTMDHAMANRDCIIEGGGDARLLALQGGHILPWPGQSWSGKPLFNTDETIHCDEDPRAPRQATEQVIVDWWDEKLRGEERQLPDVCVAIDYEHSLPMNDIPVDTEAFTIPRSQVHVPISGLFEGFMVPFDTFFDMFRGLWDNADLRFLKPNGGFGRPRFVPVHIVEGEDEVLLGTPRIEMNVAGTASLFSTRVFVGIGVQSANKRRVRVASEQITPLPEKGYFRQDLAPVAVKLERGDRVGLIIYGYNWQYFTNPSFWWSQARVSGELHLPLIESMELP